MATIMSGRTGKIAVAKESATVQASAQESDLSGVSAHSHLFTSLRVRAVLLMLAVVIVLSLAYTQNASRLVLEAGLQQLESRARQTAEILNLMAAGSTQADRLPLLRAYLELLVDDPATNELVYVVIQDDAGQRLLGVGAVADSLPLPDAEIPQAAGRGVVHVRNPLLLHGGRIGALQFGLSTQQLLVTQAAIQREGMVIFMAIGGLAIGLVVLAGLLFARRVQGLITSSQRMAAGDYRAHASEQGHDEISLLARSFNHMAQAVSRHLDEIEAGQVALRAANARLEDLATRDGLTGIFNRRYLDTQVDHLWAQVGPNTVVVLMMDVDNFKKYNDYYGHQAGDDCLIAIARAIHTAVEAVNAMTGCAGFAARYGGEEFAVIIPDTGRDDMRCYADAVLTKVRDARIPHELNGTHGIATVSLGGMVARPVHDPISTVFRIADSSLYRSKESGRNCATLD